MKSLYTIILFFFFSVNLFAQENCLKNINPGNLKVKFATSTDAYAVGEGGTILKTTNAGGNWTKQKTPNAYDLTSVYFKDALPGIVESL